eukprot:c6543_g1_i1.p2 GENE.c6543_g1_i1~~c6543_g1_i1.p2  ORF type:complete len:115 (+),score=15.53 c6543_g1_i1:195-539(+)
MEDQKIAELIASEGGDDSGLDSPFPPKRVHVAGNIRQAASDSPKHGIDDRHSKNPLAHVSPILCNRSTEASSPTLNNSSEEPSRRRAGLSAEISRPQDRGFESGSSGDELDGAD